MKLLCKLFGHKEGDWAAVPGGRDVLRCVRCDHILGERSYGMRDVQRWAPPHRPTGRTSDAWPK